MRGNVLSTLIAIFAFLPRERLLSLRCSCAVAVQVLSCGDIPAIR
jgi:hypothetical protein